MKLYSLKREAASRGLECTICVDDVYPTSLCPLLGEPLAYGAQPGHPYLPSIDRIDSSRGYVPGNVWVVSRRASTIKSDATLAEIEALIAALERMENECLIY